MNIEDFSTHGQFNGISNLVRIQREPVDVASFVFAHPARSPIVEIAQEFLKRAYPRIPWGAITGESRNMELVHARHHMWWHVKQMRPDISVSEMGRKFRRDRTTIMHGVEMHQRRMNTK